MITIQNKLALGLISGLLGELVIMLSNGLCLKLGLIQSSLKTMAIQVVKCRKWIPLTTKRDLWLSYGVSTFFCTSGGLFITYLLSFTKRFYLLKGFILGTVGGLVPYIFKQFKLIKDLKKPLSKAICFLSHGFFGLTVALVFKILDKGSKP
jgi:hypothetical protein